MTCPSLTRLLAEQPLCGRIVELHLLTGEDYRELAPSCLDPDVWRSTIAKINTEEELREYLGRGLTQLADGSAVPLLIRLADGEMAVGSTRLAISSEQGVLEIGWTFIAPAYHRRGVNAETKLLLLDYCFGILGCSKVIFKVASGNERSKAALARLGAVPSLSEHRVGVIGGIAIEWFELLVADWPSRRRDLEARLQCTS
jgi:RimJ/RimL family protein N-acetyltransferase